MYFIYQSDTDKYFTIFLDGIQSHYYEIIKLNSSHKVNISKCCYILMIKNTKF